LSGPLSIRTARRSDLDRLVEIHLSAFPDPRGVEARRRLLSSHDLGGLDCLFVAERGGRVLAHAFLFEIRVWFGGRRVNVGAIASVAVAPEARGEALARALLDELHQRAHARGDALTLLYPFRQGFYARHGYVAVSPTQLLLLHPRAIPESWGAPSDAPGTVRAAVAEDRPGIEAAYERSARGRTGWLDRPERLWERRLLDERTKWFVLERQGIIAGYVCWTARQLEAHAEARLEVSDLVADDEPARRRLLALIGAQRDQVTEVTLEVEAGDPIDRALVDADLARHGTERVEHALGMLVGGPMLRLLDVARAVEARGYRSNGALDVAVDGAPPQSVEIRDGQAKWGPSRGGPLLCVERSTLGAILYGGLPASRAARIGWLSADSPDTLRLADELFGHPPFFALDPF
jgi:predicted acetyltransferase